MNEKMDVMIGMFQQLAVPEQKPLSALDDTMGGVSTLRNNDKKLRLPAMPSHSRKSRSSDWAIRREKLERELAERNKSFLPKDCPEPFRFTVRHLLPALTQV